MTATIYLQAVMATVVRDARVYMTYRLRLVSQVLGSLLTLTVFFYVAKLARRDVVGHSASYYAYLVVGILAMAILEAALSLSTLVRLELVAGNFERMLISPLGPIGGVLAMTVFPIAYATMFAGFMLVVAHFVYAIPLHLSGVLPALGATILGAGAFAAIGILFVAALIAYKSSTGPTWVMAGLGLVAGIYFPIRLFPGWLRWATDVQPLTPAVDLFRHLLVGTPSIQPVWLEYVKLAGFAGVLMPLSTAVLRQALKISRRRGTIMEY